MMMVIYVSKKYESILLPHMLDKCSRSLHHTVWDRIVHKAATNKWTQTRFPSQCVGQILSGIGRTLSYDTKPWMWVHKYISIHSNYANPWCFSTKSPSSMKTAPHTKVITPIARPRLLDDRDDKRSEAVDVVGANAAPPLWHEGNQE